MGELVQLDIKPKTMRRTYKRHHYVVTFVPATKQWQWTVEYIVKTEYTDTADTMQKAFKAAEKCIDRMVAIEVQRTG